MGLYHYIKNIDSAYAFLYLVILVGGIFIFKNKNVTLSIVLGLIISIAIIVYLNEKRTTKVANKVAEHKFKTDNIRPFNEKLEKYGDIVDFVYSIQEYYYYNPEAFEEMLEQLEHFLIIYEDCIKAPGKSHSLFEILDQKKHNILNSLHSIIYTLPAENATNFKFDKALDTLEDILKEHQEKIYYITRKDLHENGYSLKYKIPNLGPKPRDFYSNEAFTYDVL